MEMILTQPSSKTISPPPQSNPVKGIAYTAVFWRGSNQSQLNVRYYAQGDMKLNVVSRSMRPTHSLLAYYWFNGVLDEVYLATKTYGSRIYVKVSGKPIRTKTTHRTGQSNKLKHHKKVTIQLPPSQVN